jgi:uncharacterized protein (DUF1778 family)
MPVSQAQIKAQSKWESKVYEKILLRLRSDGDLTRADIQQAAEKENKSINQFIIDAVKEKIEKVPE